MKLDSFYKLIDLKKVHYKDSDRLSIFKDNEVKNVITRNQESLINDFFDVVGKRLDQKKYKKLYEQCEILGFITIPDDFYERLGKMTFVSMDIMITDYEKHDIRDLAEFIWQMLDYTLHEWTISNEKAFMNRLLLFQNQLEMMNKSYPEYVSYLRQKIEHFGIK
jgi:hypothetical protein